MAQRVETVVIGGGQAGLATGYYLARLGREFVILDAGTRVGDSWRQRWDSLRLFTPARYDGLPGMSFPAPPWTFPTKDAMADFLETYAARFRLPVVCGTRVDAVRRQDGRYVVSAGARCYLAENVVVAMASYQRPRVPAFAGDLADGIVQLHSSSYRHPGQLRQGPVLVVGAGNSGAEIAKELAAHRRVLLSGRDTGQLPFRIDGTAARSGLVRLVLRGLFHRVLTVDTPVGRKVRATILTRGGPLIRVKRRHLAAAGVQRVPRMTAVHDGQPVLEDGRRVSVTNVVWCTGYDSDLRWVDVPVGEHEPEHRAGVVPDRPGLYFVGLHFQYSLSSTMTHGVARDARRVVAHLDARPRATAPTEAPTTTRPLASRAALEDQA